MQVTSLLTGHVLGWGRLAVLLALAAAAAGVTWWGLAPRIDLQADRTARTAQLLADAQRMIELQGSVLAEQQRQIGAITEIEREMRRLGQTITRTAAEQAAAIEELKQNDQAVADWMRGHVPAALGRLYERPETTDPTAYRSPAKLSAYTMPTTGSASDAGQ